MMTIYKYKFYQFLFYILEVSTGPKFPARPAKFFFRPGPARNQCIIKFVLYNFF